LVEATLLCRREFQDRVVGQSLALDVFEDDESREGLGAAAYDTRVDLGDGDCRLLGNQPRETTFLGTWTCKGVWGSWALLHGSNLTLELAPGPMCQTRPQGQADHPPIHRARLLLLIAGTLGAELDEIDWTI